MAILLGAVALFYFWRGRGASNLKVDFPQDAGVAQDKSVGMALAIVSILYALLTFAMYLYYMRTAAWLMWEVRHFLHRTWLMDIYSLRPYTQFSAEYGPLLTVTPLYCHWLLKPFGASYEQAYFLSHLLLNLAGLWCAYYVLSRATMPPRLRVITFALLAVAGFAPYMGLNGVLLRYLCPFACLLLGHRAMFGSTRTKSKLRVAAMVFVFLAVNILLSPEAAIAFALSWLSYGVLLACRGERKVLAVSIIAFVVAGVSCWLCLPSSYYGSLVRFSEGANNLPLLPAAHLVLYIVTLFLIVPFLLVAGIQHVSTKGTAPALAGAFGVLCLAMAPGALGRCDPPHVLFFGIGASMLLLIRLANTSRPAFLGYALAYGAVFIILMQVVNLRVFFGVSPTALLSGNPFTYLTDKMRSANGIGDPDAATWAALNHYPRLGLPFATFGDAAVERHVLTRGQLEPEYYISVAGVYTETALERKLSDLGKMEYLLMPSRMELHKPPNPCAEYRKSLREWFLYPARLPCRADPLDPGASVNYFIAAHFVPVEHIGSWVVLHRNSSLP